MPAFELVDEPVHDPSILAEAARLALDACDQSSDRPAFVHALALVRLRQGMTQEAVSMLEQLVDVTDPGPDLATFETTLALAFIAQGGSSDARALVADAEGVEGWNPLLDEVKAGLSGS